ncbi:hypothetical protein DYL61_21585 [Pseudomonas nabeulensis]|uniref:Uncharacterized protein n=1 Tax=Pseudomonas nabeulensis TaxID=2293833 RepID=A0A4Z0AU20_9PSED|nr:hypothetical protein [Pseudomonas nabeulensis]TFY89910.1 hypothetical protein DYL61_21585 [Pseudomonas nabeulensis]
MSLKLTVTDKKLKALLAKINKDKKIDPAEFIDLRKQADDEVAKSSLLAVRDNMRIIGNAADILADAMKILYLELRRLDYGVPDKDPVKNAKKDAEKAALKKAVEYQLAYVITSYEFTLGKL